MQISPFFRNLRASYQAEIDDMASDSEGKDVLRRRLAQRRTEIDFLVHMIEMSPEMVAVVFHQGMRFTSAGVLEHLIAQDDDSLPEWDAIQDSVELTPWAQELATKVRKQPLGDWFLTLAAGLEYMYYRHDPTMVAHDDSHSEHGHGKHADHHDDDHHGNMDSDHVVEPHDKEEAGAEWMAAHGFERKE